jgi:hypothetical protein
VTYEIVYATLVFGGFLTQGSPPSRRLLYGLFLVGLFVFVGFRYEVGCDWTGYRKIFEYLRYGTVEDAITRTEPGFALSNLLLHYYDLEYPYINVIASALFFMGFHFLARRQPDRLGILILSFPVLIINMPMSGLRQGIAIGILCLAFNAFVDRKLVRYIGFVGCASLFHKSAMSFLLLAPFVRWELSRQTIAAGLMLTLPGAYFMATGETASEYADRYVGTSIDAAGAPFRAALLALTGGAFLLFFSKHWARIYPHDYKLMRIGACMMLAVFPIVFFSSVIGDRFGYYLNPIQLIILARLPFLLKNASLMSAAPYAGSGLVLVVWSRLSTLFNQCYVPYKLWL